MEMCRMEVDFGMRCKFGFHSRKDECVEVGEGEGLVLVRCSKLYYICLLGRGLLN